jgi:hypothetical protein
MPKPTSHPPNPLLRAVLRSLPFLAILSLAACQGQQPSHAALADLEERLSERFTPGLHSLMMELQHRHATLWFAGEAENWPLTDYFLHEMEELMEDIGDLHPTHHDLRLADLLADVSLPAVEAMEDAVEAEDLPRFIAAYDELTMACNGCHAPADKAAIVIQRPTVPPLTNLRFVPER